MKRKEPGARWLACDLHVHTPLDPERRFGENVPAAIEVLRKQPPAKLTEIAERFITACSAAINGQGLDVVAVTDHNSIDGYRLLRPHFEAVLAHRSSPGPAVLPGVEFSVGGERPIHFLVIFARDTDPDLIDRTVSHVFGAANRFNPSGVPQTTGQSVDDFLSKLYGFCQPPTGERKMHFVILPAHAETRSGIVRETGTFARVVAPTIWEEMKGLVRTRAIVRQDWHGFQTNAPCGELPEGFRELLYRWMAFRQGNDWDKLRDDAKESIRNLRHWPLVEASDPHSYGDLGSRFTWLKMEVPDVEGLRLALLDPESRLRRRLDGLPARTYPTIETITITNTDFLQSETIEFNGSLNTLIGGRGSGKSTLVEYLRYVLDRNRMEDFDDKESEIRGRIESLLSEKTARDFGQTPGTLLPNHTIEAVISVAGREYKAIRQPDGLKVEMLGSDSEKPLSEIDIRSLLLPRILSQGQISRIAQDPQAQRRELDALVPGDERQAVEKQIYERYQLLTDLQVSVGKLKDQIETLPARQTELQKVKDQIAFLEGEGQREILDLFQSHTRERDWLQDLSKTVESTVGRLKELNLEAQKSASAVSLVPQGTHREWLTSVRGRVAAALDDLAKALEKQMRNFSELREAVTKEGQQGWAPDFARAKESYEQLSREMSARGVNFAQHERLISQRSSLEKEVARLSTLAEQLEATQNQVRDARKSLIEAREALFRLRQDEALNLERRGADVKLEIIPFGDQSHLEAQLQDWFAGAGMREGDLKAIADYVFFEDVGITDRLLQLARALTEDVEHTKKHGKVIGPESSKLVGLLAAENIQVSGYYTRALEQSGRIRLRDIESFIPEDRIAALVRRRDGVFRPITQGSVGERSMAILSLVLSASEQPLIIDQPEEDLDNQYVYHVVVSLLRKLKFERQMIIATHNANIPVNGDAELIVGLSVENALGNVERNGSIDREDVKDMVSLVMEGSAEAFRLRKERYGF